MTVLVYAAPVAIGASVVSARTDRRGRGAAAAAALASGVRHHLEARLAAVWRSRSAKQSQWQCVSPSGCAPFARPKYGEELRTVVVVKQREESPKERFDLGLYRVITLLFRSNVRYEHAQSRFCLLG